MCEHSLKRNEKRQTHDLNIAKSILGTVVALPEMFAVEAVRAVELRRLAWLITLEFSEPLSLVLSEWKHHDKHIVDKGHIFKALIRYYF